MKKLILLLSLFIFGKYAYTQNITCVNAENNIPVAEVSIISKTNANLGVISDLNGNANLEIFSLGDTLLAMHIGFSNKKREDYNFSCIVLIRVGNRPLYFIRKIIYTGYERGFASASD